MRRLQHLIEYAGLRCALLCVRVLPERCTGWLAALFAGVLYVGLPARRRTAWENIRRAGIASDEREIRRIARASFWHYSLVFLETFKSAFVRAGDDWGDRVEVDIPDDVRALLDKPTQGLIIASAHLGNWEIAARFVARMKPVTGITREMNNPYIEALIQRYKPSHGFTMTPKHNADSKRLIQVLYAGEVLAIMADQHAGPRGLWLDFFGRPASTHKSLAMLHLITGTPLVFGYCLRTGPMRYRLKLFSPIIHQRTGNREQDVRAILEILNQHMEQAIREAPEQYLWAHRRWRQQSNS